MSATQEEIERSKHWAIALSNQPPSEYPDDLLEMARALLTLASQLSAAREALRKYGWHQHDCAAIASGNPDDCNCGWLALTPSEPCG